MTNWSLRFSNAQVTGNDGVDTGSTWFGYAETNGYERDATKPGVWKYRDYVIRSLNQDKPYDRFILEQLAGDELPDRSAETHIATGFTRLGPWDDEPADFAQDRFDQLDDIVRTTSEVFLGMTLGCARCHDHKFDPITQRDYYSMVAIFDGLQRPRDGRREVDSPIGTREQLDRLAIRDAEIAPLAQEIESLREDFRTSFLASGQSALPKEASQAFLTDPKERTEEQKKGHPVNGEVGTWLAPSGSQICSPFACPYSRLQ